MSRYPWFHCPPGSSTLGRRLLTGAIIFFSLVAIRVAMYEVSVRMYSNAWYASSIVLSDMFFRYVFIRLLLVPYQMDVSTIPVNKRTVSRVSRILFLIFIAVRLLCGWWFSGLRGRRGRPYAILNSCVTIHTVSCTRCTASGQYNDGAGIRLLTVRRLLNEPDAVTVSARSGCEQ